MIAKRDTLRMVQETALKRIYSFALGNIWRWSSSTNRNGLFRFIKHLNISGVEITFSSEKELHDFNLSKENISWLRTLSYVTIHAPFTLFASKNHEKIVQHLKAISALYHRIDAKNVIVHPGPLEDMALLGRFAFNVSVENMPPKDRFDIAALKRILDEFQEYSLCLDVSHAYLWSKFETGNLIEAFGPRISQVHLSGTYRRKCHQSLKCVTKTFLDSICPVSLLEAPLVIEGDIKEKSFRTLSEEVAFIQNYFGDTPAR